MKFSQYLQDQSYSTSTVKEYVRKVQLFIGWTTENGIDAEQINYGRLMEYVNHLQNKKNQSATINNELSALKTYFQYLIYEGIRIDNPAEGLVIKGGKKKVLHNLLDSDELEDLYYSFDTKSIERVDFKVAAQRNKIMVGLMVYQGLNTTDLKALEINHAQPYKGKIEVPGTRRSNARTLELKPWQVIELMEYINEVRPQIAKQRKERNENLFIPNIKGLNRVIHVLHLIRC